MRAVFAPLAVLASIGLCAAPWAHAAGSVEVSYTNPDDYTDAGRSGIDRSRTMQTLTPYLQKLGARLPDGQTLRIEVTDIDLAGAIEPFSRYGWNDVRVLRGGADWPHMDLRFTLQGDGRTLKSGQAKLVDINYLFAARLGDTDRGDLAFEKRMLLNWFQDTFTTP